MSEALVINLPNAIEEASKKLNQKKKDETWKGTIGERRELALLKEVQKVKGHLSRDGDSAEKKFKAIKEALEKTNDWKDHPGLD